MLGGLDYRAVVPRLNRVEGKTRYIVNVKDPAYRAKGNGTTNDTTALQAALNAVNSDGLGGLYVPAGTYLTGELDWPGNNIALIGAGSGYGYNTADTPRTTLKAAAGTTNILDLVQTGTAEDRKNNIIANIEVDGNSIATNGVKVSGSNLLHRVRATGCTDAGFLLDNFTNSTRLEECAGVSNSGVGLKAQGVSTTKFAVVASNFDLNTVGGVNCETGFGVSFEDCIFESNDGYGARIFRPNTHTNLLGNFNFKTCWFEDPGTVDLVIDAQTRDHANAPQRIRFDNSHFSVPTVTKDYADLLCCKVVTFDHCHFSGSTNTGALNVNATAFQVGIVDSHEGRPGGSDGLTAAQLNHLVSTGVLCYVSSTRSPAVRAQRTGTNQSFTASTFTAVVYNSELMADTWGSYDEITGRFTPTVPGDYLVSASVGLSGDTAATRVLLSIFKNSVEFVRLSDVTATDIDVISGTFIVPMDNDDYLEVHIWSNATNPVVLNGTPNSILNIKKIGNLG